MHQEVRLQHHTIHPLTFIFISALFGVEGKEEERRGLNEMESTQDSKNEMESHPVVWAIFLNLSNSPFCYHPSGYPSFHCLL
jgi:hypothetical protein